MTGDRTALTLKHVPTKIFEIVVTKLYKNTYERFFL